MAKEQRPRIVLEQTGFDRVIEGLSLSALLVLILLPAVYYGDLPDTIPQHFNAKGEADGFGSKTFLWFLPGLGVALYTMMTLISRSPHTFNYMVKITEANAAEQYRMATRLVRWLKLFVMLLFVYITWGIINGAMSGQTRLSPWFVFVVLAVNFGTIGWYWSASWRKR